MSEEVANETSGRFTGAESAGGTVSEVTTDEFMVKMSECEEPKVGQHYYRMVSDPRGFCLIFNVFEFPDSSDYNIRKGSVNEAKNLSTVFEELHFIPKVFNNPSKDCIESAVKEYSQKPELEDHNAIVLIVLSHGKRDGFIASDGQYIAFKDIIDKLNNKNCRKLIDKPKLFFFSCCRGDSTDSGVAHSIQALEDMQLNVVSDAVVVTTPTSENARSFTTRLFPMVSDMMICYSTVDGYVSWRCEENGTWLGLALHDVLIKHSHNRDLLRMLTYISQAVDERVANAGCPAKQVVEIILRGFKRTFYFNNGYIVKPSVSGDDNTAETEL